MAILLAFLLVGIIMTGVMGCSPSSGGGGSSDSNANINYVLMAVESGYASADQESCTGVYMMGADLLGSVPPRLTVNLGEVRDMDRILGGWKAELCAGDQTGKVKFNLPGYHVFEFPEFYFVPPELEDYSDRVAAAAFTMTVNPQTQKVVITTSDLDDGHSVGVGVRLYEPGGVAFLGQMVIVAVTVSGDSTPIDLLSVRARLTEISDPAVTVFSDGRDPEPEGAPWFDYGGFRSTADVVADTGEPSSWTKIWTMNITSNEPFTITGEVLVELPAADDINAGFRIRPYLTSRSGDRVTVNWETDRESRSFVVYGPTPECELVAEGRGERNQIDFDFTYISPPRFDSFFHRAEIHGLDPDATMYYRVIAVREPTPAEAFVTRASPGREFSFGVISDTQNGDVVHAGLVSLMKELPTAFILHSGDLVQFSNDQSEWLNFFRIEAPLLKNRVLYPAVGNHDLERMDLLFLRYFDPNRDPSAPPGNSARFYSFDFGNSHFVSLDTNLPVAPGSEQYEWVAQDLAAAYNDPDRKFTFVIEHLAVNTAFVHGSYPQGKAFLQPLYDAYDVDAVFAGHVHLYERSDVHGKIHITNGGGGGYPHFEAPILALNPFYLFHIVTNHFLTVTVGEDSFEIQAFNLAGELMDEVVYTKP